MSRLRIPILLTFLAVPVVACTAYPRLEPAANGASLDNGQRATSSAEGVTVTVATEPWPAEAELRQHTTPLEITVQNRSDQPLSLRYEDFSMVDSKGRAYAAVPPFKVQGEVTEAVGTAVVHPLFPRPRFRHSGFFISPHWAPYYPGMRPFDGHFYYDPRYHDRYVTVLENVELPTEEMLARALPEGVIEPRGEVHGVLFFEPIDASVDRVTLRFDLVNGESDFGSVSIPFDVS